MKDMAKKATNRKVSLGEKYFNMPPIVSGGWISLLELLFSQYLRKLNLAPLGWHTLKVTVRNSAFLVGPNPK